MKKAAIYYECLYDIIKKLEAEIKDLKQIAEKEYKKSYGEMYNCYLKNSYAVDYHINISYIEGKENTLENVRRSSNDFWHEMEKESRLSND